MFLCTNFLPPHRKVKVKYMPPPPPSMLNFFPDNADLSFSYHSSFQKLTAAIKATVTALRFHGQIELMKTRVERPVKLDWTGNLNKTVPIALVLNFMSLFQTPAMVQHITMEPHNPSWSFAVACQMIFLE